MGRWYKGAKLSYRASLKTWEATGRWPRGSDSEAYEGVIDAGTDVKRLQPGVRDQKLVRLLNSLRSDIESMCKARSPQTANHAAAKMVRHFEASSDRMAYVWTEEMKRFQTIG